jgi:hypothetical protein
MYGELVYVCVAQLRGRTTYFLWHSDPDSPEPDGVLLDGESRIPAFATEAAARSYAVAQGRAVAADPPSAYDLDRVAAWCDEPTQIALDYAALLDTWNLYTDLGPVLGSATNLFAHSEQRANALYEKLFLGNNLPSMTPAGEHYTPTWTTPELLHLSRILRLGFEEFARRLRVAEQAG